MSDKSKTFIWKDLGNWRGAIHKTIPKRLRTKIVAEIQNTTNSFQYIDDFTHFKDFYSKFADYSSFEDVFLTTFPANFVFVRMFHCCRPPNTETYYSEGIHVLDSSEANERFRKLFLGNPRFPRISEHLVNAAISDMADKSTQSTRYGHVYFGLDDRFLIRHAGHYLIYGSEYTLCLATFIEEKTGYDLKSELRTVGKPTIFEVNMPVAKFQIEELTALAHEALPAWAYCIAHRRNELQPLDFAITIRQSLPPEFILSHYHPKEIPDPFRAQMIYKYRTACIEGR